MEPSLEAQDGSTYDFLFGDGVLAQRNAAGGGQAAMDAVPETASASAGSSAVYVGIGVGLGAVILISVAAVGGLIWRKRQHRREVAELDHNGTPVCMRQSADIREVPRPVSAARCTTLVPLNAHAGWGALSSDETVYQSEPVARVNKKKRGSVSLPRKLKQRTIPLRRMKHLSAIIESPRSRSAKSPSPAQPDIVVTPAKPRSSEKSMFRKTITLIHSAEREEDVFTAPGSPKPNVLPSFAIGSPGMYGAAIANDDRPKMPRSVSVGAMPDPPSSAPELPSQKTRPQMHSRSLSLDAPPSQPPTGPVPPLPERSMLHDILTAGNDNRRPVLVPRHFSSSGQSTSSSVLITSPLLALRDDCTKQLGLPSPSPTVEQVVAEDEGAQLKSVPVMNRQWQNPLITGPRPMDEPRLDESKSAPALIRPRLERNPASVRSNMARYSTTSDLDQRLSIASIDSDNGMKLDNRLSIPQIGTAARLSVSRVSSSNSIPGISSAGVQKVRVTTPRRSPRHSTVSADGSPAEREKKTIRPVLGASATTSVLQSISHHAVSASLTPTREASHSTQSSGRGSNGNRFQWDHSMPLIKPSALKGSPTAKGTKGHRRQNCVRISTLTPQILGPPPSRPSSPGFMDGIAEEEAEDFKSDAEAGMRFISSQQNRLLLQRPASASSLVPMNPRVQTLRASLTPSSPTLSTWTAWQAQQGERGASGLPSQHSDSQLSHLSVSDITNRTGSRQTSARSSVSALSIPPFPSPSHTLVATPSLSRDVVAVPQFSLQRPSTDEAMPQSSSPFAMHMSSEDDEAEDEPTELPSSPPLPISKTQEYDPAWPMLHIPKRGGREYDLTSPSWPDKAADNQITATEMDRSSISYFPFAAPRDFDHRPGSVMVDHEDECLSPRSRPSSYSRYGDMPDTPPCSPKTIPEGFRDLFGGTAHTSSVPLPMEPRPESPKGAWLRRSAEKLTSANASAIMATIPEVPHSVGFPSAVLILAPPRPAIDPHATSGGSARRSRAVSSVHPVVPSPGPLPAGQAPTAVMVAPSSSASATDSSPMPPPLKIHTRADSNGSVRSPSVSPRGPRSEPGKSVLKNAIALRRMNSEIDTTTRSDRRYTHLHREPSPLLPWCASPDIDPSESFNDMFDFELGSRSDTQTSAGAAADNSSDVLYSDGNYARSALDDIDFADLDKTIDGALAGFQNGPSSTASLKSRASVGVWEDGEKFWSSPSVVDKENWRPSGAGVELKLASSSPIDAVTTPKLAKKMNGLGVVNSTKRLGGAGGGYEFDPRGNESRPNSILKTPKSLYDSDGFLKSEGDCRG